MADKDNTQEYPRFIHLSTVIQMTGKARSTILEDVSEGTFPSPVKVGKRATRWVAGEVLDWMQDRIENHRVA